MATRLLQPAVIEDSLLFLLDDPESRWSRVTLDCDEAIPGRRRFRRTTAGWTLVLARPPVQRLEYRLLLTDRSGDSTLVCDPANPERVRTAFGERSVALMPGYRPPAWTRADSAAGTYADADVDDPTVGTIPVRVWSPGGLPADRPAPLLLVHDGPEYDDLAGITRYAASMIQTGSLSPFRIALLRPVRRDEWYAANDDYVRAERRVIDTLAPLTDPGRPVGAVGASMGGLCALLLALSDERVGGVLAQSGSFFTPALDDQESGYPYFDRVVSAVSAVTGETTVAPTLHVSLTCGELEENHDNNHAMAAALRDLGHDVEIRDVADLHNYTAWRDCLDPALTSLLRTLWGGRG